jgi:hypothetical protein
MKLHFAHTVYLCVRTILATTANISLYNPNLSSYLWRYKIFSVRQELDLHIYTVD